MHGRLKVKTTEEQKAEKKKEQQKKLLAYRAGMKKILSTRKNSPYDPESFAISSQLLGLNPDIYTLWNYRKEVVLMEQENSTKDELEGEEKLAAFLDKEISLTEHCLLSNPKSYGSWHHRYWILMLHPKPNWDKEFNLCTKYLTYDDRNFHCWDYRRLITNKIGITLSAEMKFSTDRLNNNFSNYSSWHYRSTLRKLDESCIEEELNLVQSAVFTDPMDSSAWFYLRWVLSHPVLSAEKRQEVLEAFEQLQELEPDCKWILLAKCWLTGSLVLSDSQYVDKRIQFYNELIKLDPKRKGQYQDYLKIAESKIKVMAES
ncbi:geranylgeranyl transferase type-2 subunit alpha [Anthonomus grandis grandis]|uniref:geranylgeranyl transferase type-2 subunit alpha n=1 Tax=Anthonomus grandis grandis TaxID=2921223 RepID=UPI002166509B|nr:geranylgeranyl transferase type-2 subunit alpha [Anthonomus grandis grandis]XP_050301889.1 geranylgeranyl transferase type-2 subunit alpha [Anthonomus grandis grandis]